MRVSSGNTFSLQLSCPPAAAKGCKRAKWWHHGSAHRQCNISAKHEDPKALRSSKLLKTVSGKVFLSLFLPRSVSP